MVKQNKFFRFFVPLILLVYPMVKIAVGVDYMDSMYSPGNFVFFPKLEGTWVIATFLSNVTGFLLTKLPGAGTYLGLRIYTNLFISALALISYFWLIKKIPAWIAALGEIIAIGFCWCPATILYNYLTYFFMLLGTVFLYEGLVQEKSWKLPVAGVFLGCNLFVRFPNVVETGFILAVWVYGVWKKKKASRVFNETVWCMAGYFGSVFLMMGVIIALYGTHAYAEMIQSLFLMTDSATSYKPFEMVLAVLREYVKGLKWPLGMALYAAAVSGIFYVFSHWFPKWYHRLKWILKTGCVLGILVLFRWYYGQGMFNVNYNTYPSIFQWGVCFLILAIAVSVILLFRKTAAEEDLNRKLLYFIILLTVVITPVGSNNNLFPIMNNLFLVAPLTIYGLYHLMKQRFCFDQCFPVKAVLAAIVAAVTVQSVGFGLVFSFRGAREGEKRDTKIEKNDILKGMVTNSEKAQAIEELTLYWETWHREETGEVILFGHIPGVSYFLNTPCAISTSWPDLASYPFETFKKEMKELQGKISEKGEKSPPVIVSYGVSAVLSDDATAMDRYVNHMESGEEELQLLEASPKIKYLGEFLKHNSYCKSFENQRFVVYEPHTERKNQK